MSVSIAAKRNQPREYWAAEPKTVEFCINAIQRIQRYRRWLDMTGRGWRALRAWRTFYGYAPDGIGDSSAIRPSGPQGEWTEVTTNEFAMLVQGSMARLTDRKAAFKAIPINTDAKSQSQAITAEGVLADYARRLGVEEREYTTKFLAVLSSEGWLARAWDANAGDQVLDDPSGALGRAGDVRCYPLSLFDVAYDGDTQDTDSLDWFGFRRRYNRFHLAAQLEAKAAKCTDPEKCKQYLEAAEQLRLTVSADMAEVWTDTGFDLKNRHVTQYDTQTSPDLVWAWEFRIPPSPALEPGRLVRFVNDKCVLYDSMEPGEDGKPGGYPYVYNGIAQLEVDRCAPEDVVGTASGHTSSFDLLSLQECMDNTVTQMASAANVGGIQNLWTPPGSGLTVSQLDGSMNHVVSQTKPERLEGVTIDPQAAPFLGLIRDLMRKRIGENEVSQGEPTKGMPAQAMALLEARAVQFANKLVREAGKLDERNRTGILRILKAFAKSPEGQKRVAAVQGKSGQWRTIDWASEDIEGADRISLEAVPPELQTFSGRSTMLDMMMQRQLVTNPKQALAFLTTGKLEPVFEWDEANLVRIQLNRELLMQGIGLPPVDVAASQQQAMAAARAGQPPPMPVFVDDGQPHIRPLMTDTPWVDIKEYAAVLKAPGVRDDPNITKATLDAIHACRAMWEQTPPWLQALLGCPPEFIVYPPGMVPPPAPGQTTGAAPPHDGRPSGTHPPVPGQPSGAPSVKQPSQPTPPPNPITGQKQPAPMQETAA